MKLAYLLLFVQLFVSCIYSNAQLIETFDNVMIPMRDGESIAADVYIPSGVDSAEVILIQTPYNKELFNNGMPLGVGENLDSQPYIWVIVDWRGFYGSNGADLSNFTRGEDGYDVCQWISEQVWHKDRIGTWGPSALGGVQYHTAREQHPNHTCAVPLVAHPHNSYDSYFYGGVLEKARLEQLDALGYGLSPVVLGNPYYSVAWQFAETGSWYPQDIIIPTLQIGGWYDHNIDKMMTWYESVRSLSPLPDEQWLLVGPWVHGGTGIAYVGSSIQGELSYPNAEKKSDTLAWDFLNYYLLDTPNSWDQTPQITYYQTGQNQWNTTNSATINETVFQTLYLNANQLFPSVGNTSASFISDPSNPSPTIGGATLHTSLDQGPYDQSSLDSRSDIATYTSFELSQDVEVSGRITLDLFVESDQPDCDITVRLVDQYPDGRNMGITDGAHRMRFRNGYTAADEEFMTPGNVYQVEVTLPFTNYTWKAGHKIKVYVGGNSSYRWDVNLQDGGAMYQPGTGNIANITIHQSASYPSSISLPSYGNVLGDVQLTNETDKISLVYPNPVDNELNVLTDQNPEFIRVIDLTGRILIESVSTQNFNIESLMPGKYLVELTIGDRKELISFVKN